MSQTMENVKTINSAVRTTMMLAVAGGLGYGGYMGYTEYIQPGIEAKAAIAEAEELRTVNATLSEQLEKSSLENDRLATINKLITSEGRVANVEVLEKGIDEDGVKYLEVRFTEVDEEGYPIGTSRDFTLKGDEMYIDFWVAKFEDKYIAQADELRGKSIVKFKSIFGSDQSPNQGFSLEDDSQSVPKPYQTERQSKFEAKIWADFEAVCNDPKRQGELGIRAIQGEAVYVPPREGSTYQLKLRATGDMLLKAVPKKKRRSEDEPPE